MLLLINFVRSILNMNKASETVVRLYKSRTVHILNGTMLYGNSLISYIVCLELCNYYSQLSILTN